MVQIRIFFFFFNCYSCFFGFLWFCLIFSFSSAGKKNLWKGEREKIVISFFIHIKVILKKKKGGDREKTMDFECVFYFYFFSDGGTIPTHSRYPRSYPIYQWLLPARHLVYMWICKWFLSVEKALGHVSHYLLFYEMETGKKSDNSSFGSSLEPFSHCPRCSLV